MQRLPKFLQKKLQLGGANILGQGSPFDLNTNNYQHPTRPTNYLQPNVNISQFLPQGFNSNENTQPPELIKNPEQIQQEQYQEQWKKQYPNAPIENSTTPDLRIGRKPFDWETRKMEPFPEKNPNKQPLIDGMYVGNALLRGFSENYSNNQRRQYEQDNLANPLNQLGFNDGRSRDIKYGYQQFQKGGSTIDKLIPLPKQSLNRGDVQNTFRNPSQTIIDDRAKDLTYQQQELAKRKYIGTPTGKLSLEQRDDRLKQLAQEQGLSYENGRTNTLLVPGSKTENTINRAGDLIEKGVEAEMLISGAGLVGKGLKAGVKQVAKQIAKSQESGILSNAYKLNPWANKIDPLLLKVDPEAYYRGIGKSGYDDVLNNKILKSRSVNNYPNPYFVKGAPPDAYSNGYIAELKNEAINYKGLAGDGKSQIFTSNPINLENPNLKLYKNINREYKEISKTGEPFNVEKHWLKGYKEIPKPTSTFKSEIDWNKWNKEIPENTQLMKEYEAIEQTSKANNTWMKNPDGSKFEGTPEQFVQEESKNFKKAFPEGTNDFYRGSRHHNSILNPEGTKGGYDGITFGGNKDMAKQYTIDDATPWKFMEHPENQIVKPKTPWSEPNGGLNELYQKKSNNKIHIDGKGADYQSINVPELSDTPIWTDRIASIMKDTKKDNVFIKNIYDGTLNPGDVMINNNKTGNYLKSKWGNNGMFDMTNPNIYKGLIPPAVIAGAASLQQKQQGGSISKLGYNRNPYVDKSNIQGEGIFSSKSYNKGEIIGLTHENGQPASYLGEYYNHSIKPNSQSILRGNQRYIAPLRNLKPNEEITVNYKNQPELEQPEDFKMLPGNNYKFRGQHIRETPIMQEGGKVGLYDYLNSTGKSEFAKFGKNRIALAESLGIKNYTGNETQNKKLLNILQSSSNGGSPMETISIPEKQIINRDVSKKPQEVYTPDVSSLKNYINYQPKKPINREVSKKPETINNPFPKTEELTNYINYKNPVQPESSWKDYNPNNKFVGTKPPQSNERNDNPQPSNYVKKVTLSPYNNPKATSDNTKLRGINPNVPITKSEDGFDLVNYASEKRQQFNNWKNRQDSKENPNLKEQKSNIKLNTNYNPTIITGDTIPDGKRQYHLPEVIDLNNTYLGTRNRGDLKEIETSAASITTFNPFKSSKEYFKNNKDASNSTYIGVDNEGKIKTGGKNDFADQEYKITKTFSNKVVDFNKDGSGNIKLVNSDPKASKTMLSPSINVLDDTGKTKEGKLSMLIPKGSKNTDSFGSVTGGRYIFKTLDGQQKLVSGSFNDLQKAFYQIKAKNPYVEVITLDNGSYTRGLRTKDQKLTAEDLKAYDLQNSGGGNFAYLKPSNYSDSKQKYPETYNPTPNVRTKEDKSFKEGHPLTNEQSAIVLHHTGFTDPKTDRQGVNDIFMKPGSNSSHIVINQDGSRTRYANPDKVAFHAGISKFKGRDNVNDFSLGVEFQGDTNQKPLTDKQIDSFIEYAAPLIKSKKLKLSDITTHHQIAGERKPDINDKEYDRILSKLKEKGIFEEGGSVIHAPELKGYFKKKTK